MKKTFPVNINGKVYYIDEDAYTLLQNYLSQLRATFPGEEGAEIVADIECRISELFDERAREGAMTVIVLADVNSVIETMGRPEELGDTPAREEGAAVPPPFTGTGTQVPEAPVQKRLFRDERHKVFGGVLAGLGQYLGWDVTVLRILAVVLACCTYFWPCVLIYLISWMVIPPARTPRQILEMQGQPVNLSTVGHTVIDSATPPQAPVPDGSDFANFINTAFLLVAKFFLGLLAFAGAIVAFTCGVIALVVIAAMICYFFGAAPTLLENFDISLSAPYVQGWGFAMLMLAVALPAGALLWAGCTVLFKAPAISRSALVTGLIIEVVLIVGCAVLMNLHADGELACLWGMLPTTSAAMTLG